MRRFVDALAERTSRTSSFPYDEETLKDILYELHKEEFACLRHRMRDLKEVIDTFLYTLNVASIPQLDGVDGLIKTALNNVYVNPSIGLLEKRTYFNSLVAKYEAFLKKLYYLIAHDDVPRNPNNPDKAPGLAECIFAFDCLRGLKYTTDENEQKFKAYLDMLRQWRNDEAHLSPNASEEDINAAARIISSMYIYVVSNSVRDLEESGIL